MSGDLAALVKDEKKMRKLLVDGVAEAQRAELWKRCVEYRTGYPIDGTLYDDACKALYGSTTLPQYYPVIPDFGSPVEWEQSDELKTPSPSTRSQQSLLCLLASQHPHLTHCPYIVDLLPLLLRYYDDRTTYAIASCMLNPLSSHTAHSFYFTLSSSSYLILLKKFYLFLKMDMEKLKHHLKHLGVDSVSVFNNWVERLYVSFLPQGSVYRFMDGFMYYGMHWLWTFALSLLERHKKALLKQDTVEGMSDYVYTEMNMSDVTDYLRTAVDMEGKISKANEKLKPKDIEKYAMGTVPHARETMFHSPSFRDTERSEMLDSGQLTALWCWLEADQRVCNPRLLYASSRHGYLLKTLLAQTTTADPAVPHSATLTVVKSNSGAVFGVYLSSSWVKESDAAELRRIEYAGDNDRERKREEERKKHRLPSVDGRCFVFQLAPRLAAYRQPQQRVERLKQRKEREDRENARRSLIAGREGLRHATADSHSGSSASKHLQALHLQHQSSSFLILDKPEFQSPTHANSNSDSHLLNSGPAGTAATTASDDTASTAQSKSSGRSELARQLAELMEKQRLDDAEDDGVHMMCNPDYIAIGDSTGVAFSLDQLLRKGVSQPTRAFGNGDLSEGKQADGSFDCLAVEVWGFRQPHE